ncbi:YjaA family stress response protein, partial [Pectobacterium aroidearum]|uniref:YjaA family stress response protein n=2 Tax=Pectobacterium aroidearum TaxID=1201031 RepID=UPI002161BBCF
SGKPLSEDRGFLLCAIWECVRKTKPSGRPIMNLYIQIRKNQITVRHLGTQLEASTQSAFSNNRILVADFMAASKALRSVIRQVTPFDWRSWFRSTTLLIHALEMNEGGLSPVEDRILQEITVMSCRKSRLIVISSAVPLSDSDALKRIQQK